MPYCGTCKEDCALKTIKEDDGDTGYWWNIVSRCCEDDNLYHTKLDNGVLSEPWTQDDFEFYLDSKRETDGP